MTAPESPEIDRRLREAFQDDPAAAARIARAALADDEVLARRVTRSALTVDDAGDGRLDRRPAAAKAPHARRWWAVVATGAAVVLVASALAFWPARPLPDPAAEPSEPAVLSGVITDGALVVVLPDGSTSISWGAARDDRPPDGSGIVIVEGAAK
jgi:hypothetical protein